MFTSILDSIGTFLANSGIKLLCSLVLLVVCWKLIGVLTRFVQNNSRFSKVDEGAKNFILSLISIALKVLLVLTVAANLGVPMTNVAAVVASCGLAIGLALQGSLSNFAGGIMILLFRPFTVGNYIESGGKEGTVKSISLLSSTISTVDNKDIIIPNGTLINSVITNFSTEPTRRVDLDFTVAYGVDVERVKKVLTVLAENHELVLKDPAPFARLTDQKDHGLVFTLRVWCKREHYFDVRLDLLEQVNSAFGKLEIQFPYPQLDVHMHQ